MSNCYFVGMQRVCDEVTTEGKDSDTEEEASTTLPSSMFSDLRKPCCSPS